ncbi:phosphohistidine phosphatase SixA [Pseudomonas sp. FEN]|uniref:phosphohistidine phosphatase SixA n=1 Tax=Pseudomonas sp. FEN TaxID=2767468 RepID=UPI00174D16B1|nr:phosphohistidine phosphatase SixA [Pseudomonas sp. FEN]
MRVWVLRHGEAEPQARSDAERALTTRGRQQVLRSAAHLIGQPLSAIYASPYLRAQQTAELVREVLGFEAEIITVPWLTPESNPQDVSRRLDGAHDLLLVSHQPLVGNLLSFLQHGHLHQPDPMGTASLAELEGELPLAGAMTLLNLRHP